MELPRSYPFTRLRLPSGELLRWQGYNPTFHRFDEWGMVLTDQALYWFKPAWLLGKWRRIPLGDIRGAEFRDSSWRPTLVLDTTAGLIKCRTPHDAYSDDMDFDRRKLRELLAIVQPNAVSTKGVEGVT